MRQFVLDYLDRSRELVIADVGSCGTRNYRPLFRNPEWVYVGVDLREGPNVDVVVLPYDYSVIAEGAYDVVISGQTLEHVEYPFRWMGELSRIVKVGGLVCVICPWLCGQHEGPTRRDPDAGYKDYWRVMESGMRLLLEDSCFQVLDVFQDRKRVGSGLIGDTVGIGRRLGGV